MVTASAVCRAFRPSFGEGKEAEERVGIRFPRRGGVGARLQCHFISLSAFSTRPPSLSLPHRVVTRRACPRFAPSPEATQAGVPWPSRPTGPPRRDAARCPARQRPAQAAPQKSSSSSSARLCASSCSSRCRSLMVSALVREVVKGWKGGPRPSYEVRPATPPYYRPPAPWRRACPWGVVDARWSRRAPRRGWPWRGDLDWTTPHVDVPSLGRWSSASFCAQPRSTRCASRRATCCSTENKRRDTYILYLCSTASGGTA